MADAWQLKAVLSAVDKMSPVLKSVGTMAKSTRKYLADVASSSEKLSGKVGLPFAAISGVLGGFSLMAVKNSVVGFTEMGEAVQKGALKAGMSVEQYQRMKYVAEQSGTSIEAMEGSLSKLNRQVGEAVAGKNANLSGLMTRLGVSMRDSNGQIRAGVDMLPELADAFKRNENPAIRARMGMALFGKSYAEILPLLADGSEEIGKNLERFDQIKGVLGKDEISAAKQLGDKFKDLDLVMKGFQGTIAKSLIPVLEPLINDLVLWWVANKKLVSTEVSRMAKDLAAWIKTIDFQAVLKGVEGFFSGLGRLSDAMGGARNTLIALVVFMNMGAIMAFGGLLAAVWRLVWGLGVFTVSAIPSAIASLGGLNAAMAATGAKALTLLGTLGKLGAVGAAGAAGYGLGTLLNDYVINPAVQKLSGDKDASLGTWFYDKMNPEQAQANRPPLVGAAQQVRASGQIEISFKDAPPGMRVEQYRTGGDIPINTSVGIRSLATGMP